MTTNTDDLLKKIAQLTAENAQLKKINEQAYPLKPVTVVPPEYENLFIKSQKKVGDFFKTIKLDSGSGKITIGDERYLLVRASALSYEFLNQIQALYVKEGEKQSLETGKNFLFDIAFVIGREDAKKFHNKMELIEPIDKLSAGPAHFAFTGWARVEILEGSHPSPDLNFFLKYNHANSFESDTWIAAGKHAESPICIMNAGYSSGWCSKSYGIPLTAIEISCCAMGDDSCTFIMAPPEKISDYLPTKSNHKHDYVIPVLFEREIANEKIKKSLLEKEILLKEIHHRVKNNLQIISSLLKLESSYNNDVRISEIIKISLSRIKTMSIVHEKMYRNNIGSINFAEYIISLCKMAKETFCVEENVEVIYQIDSSQIELHIDKAISCGLIVNEILSNAYKYAFKGVVSGKITVTLNCTIDEICYLTISDNGIGIPLEINFDNPATFGFDLIKMLCEQINAEITLSRIHGTTYNLTIPH